MPPAVPERFRYLWSWFLELHNRRGSGVNGPASLSWPDFDAWARRTGRAPSAWELAVIAAMDDAFFASAADVAKSARPAPKMPGVRR